MVTKTTEVRSLFKSANMELDGSSILRDDIAPLKFINGT